VLAGRHAGPSRAETPARKLHILIDASHDAAEPGGFPQRTNFSLPARPTRARRSPIISALLGYQVKELGAWEAINPHRFAGVDVVVRVAGNGAYGQWEIDAYDRWVSGGGGLLLLIEHHPLDGWRSTSAFSSEASSASPARRPHDTTAELASFTPHRFDGGGGIRSPTSAAAGSFPSQPAGGADPRPSVAAGLSRISTTTA